MMLFHILHQFVYWKTDQSLFNLTQYFTATHTIVFNFKVIVVFPYSFIVRTINLLHAKISEIVVFMLYIVNDNAVSRLTFTRIQAEDLRFAIQQIVSDQHLFNHCDT